MERIAEGHSKIVYRRPDGLLHIVLKPTLYSYTHNRAGEVAGTDELRMRFMRHLLPRVADLHSFAGFDGDALLAREVPVAHRIEVRVKRLHVGTPTHRYHGFDEARTRHGRPAVDALGRYDQLFVGFDWRNPMVHPDKGHRLADEVLPDTIADWFIDVAAARRTATGMFERIAAYLEARGFFLVDICFILSEDGRCVVSEISPDCMRVRDADGRHFDKQLWRGGDPPERILEVWQELCERCEAVD